MCRIRFAIAVLHSVVLFLGTPLSRAHAADAEIWAFQHLAFERADTRELTLSAHARIREGDSVSLYQIQPRAAFRLSEWFWAGTN